MKERYNIIKNLYKDYLIVFIKDKKNKFYKESKLICKYFSFYKLKNVNKIYIDVLEIKNIKTFENNEYNFYLSKALLMASFSDKRRK